MPLTSSLVPGTISTPSKIGWDNLVLPKTSVQSLREYVLWVKHRDQVERKWEGKITSGPMALFTGPSGTGKTLAAEVLGSVLGLDLITVGPELLVSKYIGETEKNLDALLDAATRESAVLFFDEADSLFGKRSEVKDAHDRYANLEVSYLLSKLEQYRGPAVVTTNSKEGISRDVLSKFQFVVDFPLPDATERAKLWRLYLPARAPIDNDVDTDNLAKQFEMTGGQIRNAALQAAFLAAGDSSAISNKQLTKAVKGELSKTGST